MIKALKISPLLASFINLCALKYIDKYDDLGENSSPYILYFYLIVCLRPMLPYRDWYNIFSYLTNRMSAVTKSWKPRASSYSNVLLVYNLLNSITKLRGPIMYRLTKIEEYHKSEISATNCFHHHKQVIKTGMHQTLGLNVFDCLC
jgi:hypothetical protein